MTDCVVNIALTVPSPSGPDVPASGYIEFAPSKRRDLEGSIVLPGKFKVRLDEQGEATVTLAPTADGDWAWKISERIYRGRTWYASVPEGPGPVDYDDLEEVDKTTLNPAAPMVPVWKQYVDDLVADLEAGDVDSVAGLSGTVTAAQLKTGLNLPADTAAELAVNLSAINAEIILREAEDLALQADIDTKATPADITAAVNALVDTAPGTLDTLNELAAALADDPNFATTVTNALAAKATPADITTAVANEATARDAAILARRRVQPNTIALLGASIAEMAGGTGVGIYDTPVASPSTRADGFFPWANASLGGRLTLVKNAGVGGNTSAQILARVTDVTNLATLPGYCILPDAASNDLLAGTASATIITNLQAICDALQAKGITVVIGTVLPLAGSAAHLLRMEEVNRWIRDRAGLPGFIVCDWAARWGDATTPGPKTGLSTDGTHPTPIGAGAIGKVLADAMRPHLAGSIALASHNLDGLTSNLNPMMVGTAGTASTGTSGSVATNWITLRGSGAGTMAAAKVARTDGVGGEWQQLTISGGGGQFFLYTDVAGGAVAGQKWQTEMEFEAADFSGITNCMVVVQYGPGAGTQSGYALYQAGTVALPTDITSGVLRTPVFTVPSGALTNLRTMLIFQGTAGSIKVARFRTKRIA